MGNNHLKVLLILDHAPDYREPFLLELAKIVDLTVIAQPCEPDGLASPRVRSGYQYTEIRSLHLMGFRWQPGLTRVLNQTNWKVVCSDMNMRHVARLISFLNNPALHPIWLWRGHIYGKHDFQILFLLRKYFLQHAAGCLAYSEPIAQRVTKEYGVEAVSFNNTQVRNEDFRLGCFEKHSGLRLLFVGRNQPRKRIGRLVRIAERQPDVFLRLVGPGMETLDITPAIKRSGRVELFGKTTGIDLNRHFDWADMVANPGHVGLLVMNSAQHGKGIVIDADSRHAPEYWLAKEAGQPFISFSDPDQVDQFIKDVRMNRDKMQRWGRQLQALAKKKYTIEFMVGAHYGAFREIAGKNLSG